MQFHPSRRFLVSAGLTIIFLVVGLLLLPEVVRRMAVARLAARVAAPVRIDDVDLNLFTGRARVANLIIGGGEGHRPILRLPTLDLGFTYRGLLRGEVVLRYLTFHHPQLFIERTGPARFNVLEVIRPGQGGAATGLTVEHLELRGGEVTFLDRTQTPAFERTLRAVHLTAGRLSTLPTLVLTPTSFELRIEIGQGSITMTGSATPLGRPAEVELAARVERLDPAMFAAYLPARPKVDLTGSWLNGEARYVLAYRGGAPKTHVLTASLDLGPARVLPPGGEEPVLAVAGVAARDVRLDLLAGRAEMGQLEIRQPRLRLDRDPGGTFNVAGLVPVGAAPGTARASPPWAERGLPIEVASLQIDGGAVEFADRTTTPAVTGALRDLRLALRDLNLAAGARPARVEGAARLGEAPVRVTGTLRPRPFAARLRLAATGVPLSPFQGYVDAALGTATARGGSLDGRLEVALAPRQDGGLGLEVSGVVEGRDLAVGLPGEREPLFSAERLAIDLAGMSTAPSLRAELARVQLVGAGLRLERDRAGNLNLRRLWAPRRQPGPGAAIAIRRLDVARSRVDFVDAAMTPPFTGRLSEIRAEVRQSADQADRMTLRLQGTLGDSTPIELSGWVTPIGHPLRLRLEGTLRDYALSQLNPYAEQYIRYRIRRGRVSTEVEGSYDGGTFDAENTITIRHIQLGERLGDEFRERIGIPLELALALLEGVNGEIRLRVPVSGTLTDPRFSLSGVVWNAVRNAILRVLTAPFRVLGTILTVGGKIGEVRVDPIGFLPGSLEPDPDASRQLAEVVAFLKDRPRVELQLRGRATPGEVEALKRRRLRERTEATKAATYEEALTRLYRETGGDARADPPTVDKERFLLERTTVTGEDLERLAWARARVIEDLLVRRGVEPGRLFVVSPDPGTLTDTPPGRVEVELLY